VSIDKAMGNGIHCARCVFVTTQPRPSDMYCPWCMGEAKARIAELEAMVREVIDAGNASYGKLDVWHTTATPPLAHSHPTTGDGAMSLREVREAAIRIKKLGRLIPDSSEAIGYSQTRDIHTVVDYALATIDPSPDELITADWLRDVWGWDSHGTMSMHYDHDQYTAFSWRQEDGLSFVAKSHQMRCYTTGFPVATRQQFCDLARCLGIPRKDGVK